MLHLRVGEGLVDRVDRPARHARVVEGVDPVGASVLHSLLFHQRVDGVTVLGALRAGRIVRMVDVLRDAERLAYALPHLLSGSRDVDVAVRGLDRKSVAEGKRGETGG